MSYKVDKRLGSTKSLIDMTGKRFGHLYVVGRGKNRGKTTMWECHCDCGNIMDIRGHHLRSGQTHCIKCTPRNHNVKHGLHGTRCYYVWRMMFQRCENPMAVGYSNYGGRGIRVYEGWKDFIKFLADVGERPSMRHTLDRIDINGNYEPGNVRWATAKEQCRNKRNNVILEYNGVSKTAVEWAEEFGIKVFTIYQRLNLGWDMSKIAAIKVRPIERLIEYDGQSLTMSQWSEKLGICVDTLNTRVYKGWPLSKVFYNQKYKTGKCSIKL